MHQEYYLENLKYTSFLENQDSSSFEKIKKLILDYSREDSMVLDIGCGAGNLMEMVSSKIYTFGSCLFVFKKL
jgi:cyclopropane fatty-acyl-phospholipid synthase-like methyltransferase